MTDETKKKPFGFEVSYELFNARGERLRDMLVIENPGSGQTLQLDIVNALATETITLNPLGSPSARDFHFHLHFAVGAVADRVISVLGEDWKVASVVDAQGTHVYLAWCSRSVALAPGDRLVVELRGVSSGAQAGTEVTLHFAWPEPDTQASSTRALVIQGPDEGEYELEHNLVLGVRDRRGRPDIPLRAYFVGPNQVLNVDSEVNTLTLRLFNSASVASQEKLRFRFDANQPALTSRLVVALPIGTAAARPWALGTKDQVNGVTLALDGWAVSTPEESADGSMLEWELTPSSNVELAPQASLDVTLSALKTAHPSGIANLELRYSAVAGYWDGEMVCAIEKAPLVFGRDANKDNVGIGNGQPDARLTLSNGPLLLHNAEVQNVGPLVFRSDVDGTDDDDALRFFNKKGDPATEKPLLQMSNAGVFKTLTATGKYGFIHSSGTVEVGTYVNDNVGGYVGTQSNHALHFFTNGSSPKVTLKTDGKVGVGTTSPSVALEVKGRIKDQTGFLVPVGTIVAYGGRIALGAPAGWLPCDGREYLISNYSDLHAVISDIYGAAAEGKFRVPNLMGRVPVGLTPLSSELGQTGGAATHTLTASEMPAHSHGVTDNGHTHEINVVSSDSSGKFYPNADYGPSLRQNTLSAKANISINNTGGGGAHNNMPPYLVVNYIIKY